jgi:uncharacterized protein DUF3617
MFPNRPFDASPIAPRLGNLTADMGSGEETMSRTTIGVAAMALALAACSSGQKAADSAQAASPEAAASQAAAHIKLLPGEYESSTKMLEFSMPGMPQAQMNAIRTSMSGNVAKPHRYCFTSAQAAKGPEQMVSNLRQGDCKMASFTSTAGSVSGKMECAFKGGLSSTTSFSGTYTGDSSSMTMESDQQMPGMGGKGAHMKMRVDTHRVGDCSG